MKTIKRITFFMLALFVLASCDDIYKSEALPELITKKIEQIKNEPVRNPPAEVWQFEYKGAVVYYIPPYCCDIYSDLYDATGTLIGHPDGGFSGMGDGKFTDFGSTRTNGKLLWKDQRKR